jgi:hypothetical protein
MNNEFTKKHIAHGLKVYYSQNELEITNKYNFGARWSERNLNNFITVFHMTSKNAGLVSVLLILN